MEILLKHDLTIPSRAIEMGKDRPGSSVLRHRQLIQMEGPMDADQLKCKWVQFKGALKTRWARFRDNHLVQTERSYDKCVDKAHEQYGDKKDELIKGRSTVWRGMAEGLRDQSSGRCINGNEVV